MNHRVRSQVTEVIPCIFSVYNGIKKLYSERTFMAHIVNKRLTFEPQVQVSSNELIPCIISFYDDRKNYIVIGRLWPITVSWKSIIILNLSWKEELTLYRFNPHYHCMPRDQCSLCSMMKVSDTLHPLLTRERFWYYKYY